MPIVKVSNNKPVNISTTNLESINSSSLSKNLDLIKAQTQNKLNSYINIKNAVKILENFSNDDGYIKLYTEVESNFVNNDIVYITYLENTIDTGTTFSLENPIIPFNDYYLGYKIIKINNYRNEIVIDRKYSDIPSGMKLKNQFISKISCRSGDFINDISDGVVFKNSNIFDDEFGTIEGVVSGSTISGATISIVNSSFRTNRIGSDVISNQNGEYSINLPLGSNDLICRATGYLTTGITVDVLPQITTGVTIFMFSGTTTVPSGETISFTNISTTGGTVEVNIINDGGEYIISRGACWSKSSGATLSNFNVGPSGYTTGIGTFYSNLTFLERGTIYYVRGYATNYVGISYFNELTGVTDVDLPIIDTVNVFNITKTGATSGGNIISNGGTGITSKGICWSEIDPPTTGDTYTSEPIGTEIGVFFSNLTGLTGVTEYYVRAYATNKKGIAYGDSQFFETLADVPNVSTMNVLVPTTSTGMTSGGEIIQDTFGSPGYSGGAFVTKRGVCWSSSTNTPTLENNHGYTENGSSTGSYYSYLTNLIPSTRYWIRAYGTNSAGTGYGNTVTGATDATLPSIYTTPVKNQTKSTLTSGGISSYSGGSFNGYLSWISNEGIIWSRNSGDTTSFGAYSNYNSGITGSLTFDSIMNKEFVGTSGRNYLESGTTYYVRAFATNSKGTVFGNLQSGKTLTFPTIKTYSMTNIGSTGFTTGGYDITDGGTGITSKGVCWSTSEYPIVQGSTCLSYTQQGTGTTSFSSYVSYQCVYHLGPLVIIEGEGGEVEGDSPAIIPAPLGGIWSPVSGLTPGTVYYSRAYATSSVGTSYGNQVSGRTLTTSPILVTSGYTNVSRTGATTMGYLISDGGEALTRMGVCYKVGISQTPNISDSIRTIPISTGIFSVNLTGLTADTYYSYIAFAENSKGISYGSTGLTANYFKTNSSTTPTVQTSSVTSITTTGATCGGYILDNGGTVIINKGVCWSTSPYPEITSSPHTHDGIGSSPFTSTVTGLTAGTSYYIRAYATNSTGTSYGSTASFATPIILANVSTTGITSISYSGATCGGNVTDNGGSNVTQRGVCWSTSAPPWVVGTQYTIDGQGNGTFTSYIPNLMPSTYYHVRAYAINSVGTSYGSIVNFTTSAPPLYLPTLTTDYFNVTGMVTCDVTGTVVSDGGATITERGICYQEETDPGFPTTGSTKEIVSGTVGQFTANLTGLSSGTEYVARSYAINSVGVNYGNLLTFITDEHP